MRVVVTGSTGRLGREVVAAATRAGHDVLGLSRHEPEPCDLADAAGTRLRITAFGPDVVVHAAGATNVDGCERDAADAVRRNVGTTRHVAEATAAAGAHLVYLSTNHVFDGEADRPYQEGDPTSPRSVYGATKLAGERLVGPTATTVRTAWLSTHDGDGVLGSILAAADRPGPLRFVVDEVAQPTFASDLAPVLLLLGEARHPGCLHATNEGAVSSFDLACAVLAAIGDDPGRVVPITASELPGRVAPRPRNGVLDTQLLRTTAGGGLPDHRATLDAVLRRLRPTR